MSYLPLHDWQKEIYNDIVEHNYEKISLLDIPCGCGKGVIFCHFAALYNKILVISPLKAHVNQNIKRIKKFMTNNDYLYDKYIEYDSDNKNEYPVLDTKQLSGFFEENNKCIVGITYSAVRNYRSNNLSKDETKSTINLGEIPDEILGNVLMIFDEAHNMCEKNDGVDIEDIMYFHRFKKVLLSTATPSPLVRRISSQRENRKTISIKNAIRQKYICDFNLYIPQYTENNTGNPEDMSFADMKSKVQYMINGIKKSKCKKMIVYLQNIDQCNKYEQYLAGDNENIGELHKYWNNYWIGIIHAEIKYKDRMDQLSVFQNNTQDISILLNVRILDECIDIPKCDSVFITNIIPHSDFRTVQRIFRSVRIDEDNPDKVASVFLWCDEQNDMPETLYNLKELYECYNYNKKITKISIRDDESHHENISNNMSNISFDTYAMSVDQIWNKQFMTMYNESIILGRLIPDDHISACNEPIGRWLAKQKEMFNNGQLTEKRFNILINFHYFHKYFMVDFHSIYNNTTYYGQKSKEDNETPNGIGVSISTSKNNQVKYCGEFVNGKKDGYGVWFKNSNIFMGHFDQDMKCGYGVEINRINCRKHYEGYYKDDKYSGKGKQYDFNGMLLYEGDFEEGIYHGKGIQYKNGKKRYEGEFMKGVYHGKGTLYNSYNNVLSNTMFRNGKQIKEIKEEDIEEINRETKRLRKT